MTDHASQSEVSARIVMAAQRLVGRTLDDKYELLACIGIGGSGAVYRAAQLNLGRTIAVKVLSQHDIDDPRAERRFRDEATAASQLNHPAVVSIIDFGKTRDGLMYLAMEYVRGPTLTQLLTDGGPLPVNRAIDIIAQISVGIEEAHAAGIVHADLKSDNIIVDQRRTGVDAVKVVDFGISRMVKHQPDDDQAVIGTPEYMAPELVTGGTPSVYSDQYALGIILYEILTGRTPFWSEATVEVLAGHLRAPVPPLGVFRPDLQVATLDAFLARVLAKAPEQRFASVTAMRETLQAVAKTLGRTLANICQACGAHRTESFKFCPECGQPAQRATTQELPAYRPAPEVLALPFVGREAETQALVEHLLSGNRPRNVLMLTGPEGVGKSALLRAAYAKLPAEAVVVYQVSPDPTLLASPYYPVRSLLAAMLGLPPVCSAIDIEAAVVDFGLTQRDAPGIVHLFGHACGLDELDPAERRREMLTSVHRLVVTASHRQAIALVLEDVDQFDGPSLEALMRLLALDDEATPPIILTGRGAGLPNVAAPRKVQLGRIERTHFEHMANNVRTRVPLEQVFAQSDGCPARFVHLLRFANAGGDPQGYGESAADLVAARIAMLPQQVIRLLQAVAVAGMEAHLDLIVPMLDSEDAELEQALAQAEQHALITMLGEDDVGFTSHLVRNVVYAGMPADVRRSLHHRLAQTLAQRTRAPALLGHHLDLAGQPAKALAFLVAAGDLASNQLDEAAASRFYQRALAATRELLRLGENTEALADYFVHVSLRLAESCRHRGQLVVARGLLVEAEQWAEHAAHFAAIAQGNAAMFLLDGNSTAAIATLRLAIGQSLATGDRELLCDLYLDLAASLMHRGELDQARRELAECVDVVTLGEGPATSNGPEPLWKVLRLAALINQSLGDAYQALRLAEGALTHAGRVKAHGGVARVAAMLSSMCEKAGLTGKAERYRHAAIEQLRTLGDRRATAELLLNEVPQRALIAIVGQGAIATPQRDEGVALAREIGWQDGACETAHADRKPN